MPLLRRCFPLLFLLFLLQRPLFPEDAILDEFPFAVLAGSLERPEAPEPGDRVLPDIPFSPKEGYGYVGGRPEKLLGAAAFQGRSLWPLTWREGVEKYVFRVPRGEYLVEMVFLETEVACRGGRIFDVIAEDKVLFPHLDIVEKAGDFTWLTLRGVVSVYDGWLDLRFVSVTGQRSPRVSRIRILKGEEAGSQPPPPESPRPRAEGGPERVVLRWEPVAFRGTVGYGIFRSESALGPFKALVEEPVSLTTFVDWNVTPGREYFYKVCAYSAWGAQGAYSEPVQAAARQLNELGLKVYDLRIPEEELRRLMVRQDPPAEVPGELHYLNSISYVNVRCDTAPGLWQRKKSFHLSLDEDRSHFFPQRRKSLFLSAEAGDPTLLREKLSSDAAASLGLAAPAVEPVALLLNGKFLGVYFDLETLDRRFRQRTRLDRVGLLALPTRGDHLANDWAPYGDQRGEEGNLVSLTELVHELNRVEEGEMPRFFEDRFYLDRYIDRMALAALRGEMDRSSTRRLFLKDSRNGKWEILEELHRSSAWGIRDFDSSSREASVEDARRMLLGRGLESDAPPDAISILETRFFNQPRLRLRFLDRVEGLLSGDLSPEKFDLLVDKAFGAVRGAALVDLSLCPDESGRSAFLSGPARIKADFRARAEALRRAGALERARPRAPLILAELLLLPREGEPWLEVQNVSPRALSLGEYRICGSLKALAEPIGSASGAAVLPDRTIAPGERVVLKLKRGETIPLLAGGGFLGLFHASISGRPKLEVSDALFYGPQTKGVSYGRLLPLDNEASRAQGSEGFPAGPGEWAFLSTPTPGAEQNGGELKAPPYEFRQGVVLEKSGDITLWFKTREVDGAAGSRVGRVLLKHREEGSSGFESVDLLWDDKSFRFSTVLKADPDRKRTSYYFIVVSADGIERSYPLPAPELTLFLPTRANVKINEVLPRPLKGPASLGEFIEIYNPSDQPVDLEGCFLSDSSRNSTRWRIPEGNVVKPKGFALFYADGRDRGSHTGFKLSNSGEFLGLFGRMEEGNVLIDSVAFRGMRTGESWGAAPDGSKNFKAWKDPTPGARNIPKIPEEYLKKKSQKEGPPQSAGEAAKGH